MMPPKDPFDQPGVIKAIRTWRASGDTNTMSLEAAVKNLMFNNPDYKEEGADAIREALLAGCELDTPLATFKIDGGDVGEMDLVALGILDD